jgi:omega-6 fatty acid desaturase (delta-12 desaturase)
MRTGKELILATKEFAKENQAVSWFHTISGLILLVAFLTVTQLHINIFLRLAGSLLAALMMVRMFIIYHDYLHSTILHKSAAAKVIMSVYGLLILNPQSIWKRSHNYHHKNNSKLFSASIGSYPIMTKSKFLNASSKEKFEYLAIRHPLTILFGYFFMFIYGMCISPFIADPESHRDGIAAVLIHAAIIILVLLWGGWLALLLGVLIPYFVSSAIGAYLFYAQHNFPGVTFNSNEDWNYYEAAMESSSYMVMNPVMRWFTGNIGYHHIHHLNAHIPFYRLREAMRSIPEFQSAKRTSLNPMDIHRCLRLKFWNPAEKTMIGFRELRHAHKTSHGAHVAAGKTE